MFTSYGHIKKPKYNHRFFGDFSLIVSLKHYSHCVANRLMLCCGERAACLKSLIIVIWKILPSVVANNVTYYFNDL